jgi:hypothetical protein
VVFGGHRRRSARGLADPPRTLLVPSGNKEVVGLVGRLRLGDPSVARQALQGLGEPALPVRGVGEADLGHLRSLLAVEVGERGNLVRVARDEVAEDAAGTHGRVLCRIADEP